MNALQTKIASQGTATLKVTLNALDAQITSATVNDLDSALMVRKYLLQELEVRDLAFVAAWYDKKVVA